MPHLRSLLLATGAVLLGASLAYSSAAHSRATPGFAARTAGTSVKYLPSNVLTLPDTIVGGSVTVKELSGAVAADAAGNVYVGVCGSDFRHHVVVFGGDGHNVRDFRAGNCGTGEPVRIAAGPDGLLYATRI